MIQLRSWILYILLILYTLSSFAQESGNQRDIFFEPNSSALTASSKNLLDILLSSKEINNRQYILIYGYADSTGDKKQCEIISKARAKNLKDYLIRKGLSDYNFLICSGLGKIDSLPEKSADANNASYYRKAELITENIKIKSMPISKLAKCNVNTIKNLPDSLRQTTEINDADIHTAFDEHTISITLPNGDEFLGTLSKKMKTNYGVYIWADGEKYVGQFKNDKKEGYGTYKWKTGDYFEGVWNDDKPVMGRYTENLKGKFLLKVMTDRTCRILINNTDKGIIKTGTKGSYYLKTGKSTISAISIDDSNVVSNIDYNVKVYGKEDLIFIGIDSLYQKKHIVKPIAKEETPAVPPKKDTLALSSSPKEVVPNKPEEKIIIYNKAKKSTEEIAPKPIAENIPVVDTQSKKIDLVNNTPQPQKKKNNESIKAKEITQVNQGVQSIDTGIQETKTKVAAAKVEVVPTTKTVDTKQAKDNTPTIINPTTVTEPEQRDTKKHFPDGELVASVKKEPTRKSKTAAKIKTAVTKDTLLLPETKTTDNFYKIEDEESESTGQVDEKKREDYIVTPPYLEIDTGNNMVYIPGGTFLMGSETGTSESKPKHPVTLNNFYMSRTKVSVRDFSKFILATNYLTTAEKGGFSWIVDKDLGEGREKILKKQNGVNWECDAYGRKIPPENYDLPVVHISYNDAVRYCEWLSKVTRDRYRLPTEAEWEFAAKGGMKGMETKEIEKATADNKKNSKHINPLGISDMGDNLWEWCADWYDNRYYMYGPIINPKGPIYGMLKVLRGGSNEQCAENEPYTCRFFNERQTTGSYIGFRIAKSDKL